MVARDTKFFDGTLAELEHHLRDVFLDFVHRLFDLRRLDATILHESLECELGDVPTNEIIAREHDGTRRIIDDDVDSGCLFEGDDVPSFLSDDATLDVIRW